MSDLFYKPTEAMPDGRRAQISVEYLIVVSFVTLLVVALLGVALFYSASIGDQIRFSNLNRFAKTVVTNSEEVFYSGEPSRILLRIYLPSGVSSVSVDEDELLFVVATHSGTNTISYSSAVPLQGTLSSSEGVKRIQLIAQDDHVLIQEG